jgi:hypothetical protein
MTIVWGLLRGRWWFDGYLTWIKERASLSAFDAQSDIDRVLGCD